MIRDSQDRQGTGSTRADRTGKVFLVLNGVECRCLVCEQVFTRQVSGAGVHANVVCYPPVKGRLTNEPLR